MGKQEYTWSDKGNVFILVCLPILHATQLTLALPLWVCVSIVRLCAVRFGELPKVERKVITKFSRVGGGFDHTSICTSEIAAMLRCFQTSQWSTAACTPEVKAMETCVEEHKGDPVSKH
jgi:hypothetical protein